MGALQLELPEWLCHHNVMECCLLNNTNFVGCKHFCGQYFLHLMGKGFVLLTGESENKWDVEHRWKAYKWYNE
jgi:hypothetical protein